MAPVFVMNIETTLLFLLGCFGALLGVVDAKSQLYFAPMKCHPALFMTPLLLRHRSRQPATFGFLETGPPLLKVAPSPFLKRSRLADRCEAW